MWIRIWNPISPPTSFPPLFHNVRFDENVLPMLFSGDRAFDLSFNLVIVQGSKRQDEFCISIFLFPKRVVVFFIILFFFPSDNQSNFSVR